LAAAAAACHDGPPAIGASETDPDGALVGKLESFVVDREDGPSTRESYLVLPDPGATRLRLDFDGLDAPTGTGALRAWGVRRGDSLRVLHYETDAGAGDQADGAGIGRATSALIGSSPKPRTAVFVIVDIGGGSQLNNDFANSTVFTPGKNFADVYNQISYGILQISGTVVGPLSYPASTCDYNGVARTLRPMIQGTYDHYMWYFASKLQACAWSGLGAEGNITRPQSDSWYNASTGCTVLVQEVGHNLGWMHSSTLRCPGASFADNPLTCTSSEYGNRYTPMGSGCGHFAAYDKWYGGIFSGCNGVKVTSSGTFNLLPIESACNGVQGIQIPMLKATRTADPQQGNPQPLKHYYLEYRGPWGLDTAIKTPQVMVYAGDDVHAASKTSNWTWLLDMAPSTTNTFDGLAVGQNFSDPTGGITVTVMSADTTKAVVQIDITGGVGAPPTCIDNTTLADSGPVECSAVPGLGGAAGAAGATTGTGGAGAGAGTGGARAGSGGALGGVAGTGGRGIFGGTGGFSFGSGGSGQNGTPAPGTGGRPFGLGTGGTADPTGSGGAATISGSGGATGDGPGTGGQSSGVPGTVVIGPGNIGPTGTAGSAPGPLGLGAAGSVNGGCACALGPDDPAAGWPAVLTVLALVRVARRRRRAR
jgi:MYXO-CTERM domain-containing protein